MKSISKWGALIVAVIAVAVFVVAFFGISTHYGDIETIVVNSYKNLNYGNELDTGVTYVLSPAQDGYIPTAQELQRAKSTLESRMSNFIVSDFEISCDYATGRIAVRIPYSEKTSYSASAFSDSLTTKADFAAYKGSEADESMLVFTDAEIVSAKTDGKSLLNGLSYQYSVVLKLNADGKAALRQATQALVDDAAETGEKQNISFWLDGTKISTMSIDSVIKNGAVNISSYNFSSGDAANYALMTGAGALPYAMSCTAVRDVPSVFGAKSDVVLGVALAATLALVLLYLIARYKLCGAAALVGMIGTVGGLLFVATGMFDSQKGTVVTTTAVCAFVAALLLAVVSNLRYFGALSTELKENTVTRAAAVAFKKTIGPTLLVDAVVLLGCVVLMLFGRSAAPGASILAPLFSALSLKTANYYALADFGKLLFWGVLIGLLSSVFVTRYIVYSFEQTGLAKKPALFGGAKNV